MRYFLSAMLILLLALPVEAASTNQFQPVVAYNLTSTVTVSTSTSAAIDLSGTNLVGIFIPSTFDGTTITFTASSTAAGTYVPVQDGTGATFTLTTAASNYVPLTNVAYLAGLRYLKIVTGSTQTTTDTVFTLAARPL